MACEICASEMPDASNAVVPGMNTQCHAVAERSPVLWHAVQFTWGVDGGGYYSHAAPPC
jgi:phospholipase C